MKKFLSMALAMLLVFSVLSPVTVFAENGPFPFDPENEEAIFNNLSHLGLMDYESGEIAILYPEIEGFEPTDTFAGASYDLETNTLTLNCVKSKTAALSASDMGEDFKIKLVGYNELGGVYSESESRGASITFTGDGELVLNRAGGFGGIYIDANKTPAVLHFEENVKFKAYYNDDDGMGAIYISQSSITDKEKLIQVDGSCVGFNAVAYEFSNAPIYKQIDAYDIEFSTLDYYDAGFKKDGVYYIGFEEYDEETFEPTGKYYLCSLEFDELLDSYVATDYNDGNPVATDGFEKITEYEPIQDENTEYFIGYIDEYIEGEASHKYVFYPETKDSFDLCKDENGEIYGFWQYEYEDDDGSVGVDTYIYTLVEHPTYGYVAFPCSTKNSMSGLTPIVERYVPVMNAFIDPTFIVNGGGSVKEPSTIKNITATSTNQGVKITWSANSVAEKYRIYRKADGSKKWTRLDTVGADETSFIDKTAKSGKKYIYTVKGANYVGEGKFNSTGVTHTYYEAPDVTIKTVYSGVYLRWAKVAGATKYRIYRQTSGSSKWTLIDTVTGTSFIDKTAKSGKKYYYRVRAAKGDIMSGYNVVSKYFLAAPKLSSAKNSASGVKFTWEKVNGAEGYKVYRKSGSGSFEYIGKTSKTTYTDKTAKSGTNYTYTVRAYKSQTNSAYNKTGLKLKYLEAPKISTKEYSKSIKLSWNEITGAKEYAVYRKADGESKWTKLTTTDGLTYKDTAVKNNKTYQYRVRAVNGSTLSSYRTKVVTK